jgi:hypothetical protein
MGFEEPIRSHLTRINQINLEYMMKQISQTVQFEDEGSLQDALAGRGISAQSICDQLADIIDSGVAVTIIVPGVPPRALVRKNVVERLAGVSIPGPDLLVLPF